MRLEPRLKNPVYHFLLTSASTSQRFAFRFHLTCTVSISCTSRIFKTIVYSTCYVVMFIHVRVYWRKIELLAANRNPIPSWNPTSLRAWLVDPGPVAFDPLGIHRLRIAGAALAKAVQEVSWTSKPGGSVKTLEIHPKMGVIIAYHGQDFDVIWSQQLDQVTLCWSSPEGNIAWHVFCEIAEKTMQPLTHETFKTKYRCPLRIFQLTCRATWWPWVNRCSF